jgi:kynurenine formamidase
MKKSDLFAKSIILDISATLSEQLPGTWPGHFPYVHRNWKTFGESSNYRTNFFVMDEHCGTHFDAAPHFIPPAGFPSPQASEMGDQSGDRVDLRSLCGPAAVVDVRELERDARPGESPWIQVRHIKVWEERHGSLEEGDVVIFFAGWDVHYRPGEEGYSYLDGPVRDGTTPGWPAPDTDAVVYLAGKGIVTVGTDAPSLGAVHDGVPVHQEGLRRGMHYIEGLCGLDRLPPVGAFIIFLPLKIAGSTGCPGRAVAIIPEDI